MNQPDLQITHGVNGSCADGFGAAWAISQRWPGTPVHFSDYGDAPPDVEGKSVLITDFSYPEDVLREMCAKARWITVLDHHATAQPILDAIVADRENVPNFNRVFDLNTSGAVLAWHYAMGQGRPVPWILQYVQDRDLWRFTLDGTREAHAVLMSHQRELDVWTKMAKRLEDPAQRPNVISEGASILRDRDMAVRQILEVSARMMVIAGIEVPVANVPYMLASEAGHLLCEGHPFAATYFDRGDGMRQFSLRSAEAGADVSAIAKRFGGGGHKHAAGFMVPIEQEAVPTGKKS